MHRLSGQGNDSFPFPPSASLVLQRAALFLSRFLSDARTVSDEKISHVQRITCVRPHSRAQKLCRMPFLAFSAAWLRARAGQGRRPPCCECATSHGAGDSRGGPVWDARGDKVLRPRKASPDPRPARTRFLVCLAFLHVLCGFDGCRAPALRGAEGIARALRLSTAVIRSAGLVSSRHTTLIGSTPKASMTPLCFAPLLASFSVPYRCVSPPAAPRRCAGPLSLPPSLRSGGRSSLAPLFFVPPSSPSLPLR